MFLKSALYIFKHCFRIIQHSPCFFVVFICELLFVCFISTALFVCLFLLFWVLVLYALSCCGSALPFQLRCDLFLTVSCCPLGLCEQLFILLPVWGLLVCVTICISLTRLGCCAGLSDLQCPSCTVYAHVAFQVSLSLLQVRTPASAFGRCGDCCLAAVCLRASAAEHACMLPGLWSCLQPSRGGVSLELPCLLAAAHAHQH